jgi:L-ascorbate metabolism protein UlaG (beta-lactamase superfamily)
LFIGNATLLIRYAGFTVLTDPTFVHRHEQVPIGLGMYTTRLTDPAVDIADLPPLDLVLLSHFHGDHFDQVAERDLDKSLPIVTTPGAAEELGQRGFRNTHALNTWSHVEVRKGPMQMRITSLPGRHGPPVVSFPLPDVMGSMLEFTGGNGTRRQRIYITGDTLVFDDLSEIPQRYPDIDLAFVHLGGTRLMGILVTMDAEQGVRLLRTVNPKLAIPVHFDDYDVFTSPLSDFQNEVEAQGLLDQVAFLLRGDRFDLE